MQHSVTNPFPEEALRSHSSNIILIFIRLWILFMSYDTQQCQSELIVHNTLENLNDNFLPWPF